MSTVPYSITTEKQRLSKKNEKKKRRKERKKERKKRQPSGTSWRGNRREHKAGTSLERNFQRLFFFRRSQAERYRELGHNKEYHLCVYDTTLGLRVVLGFTYVHLKVMSVQSIQMLLQTGNWYITKKLAVQLQCKKRTMHYKVLLFGSWMTLWPNDVWQRVCGEGVSVLLLSTPWRWPFHATNLLLFVDICRCQCREWRSDWYNPLKRSRTCTLGVFFKGK